MSRGPLTFRQRDVTRALKAARAAGMVPTSMKIDRDGAIVLGFGEEQREDGNSWDKALGIRYDERTGRPATNGATGT